eukprot:g4642.t1
MRFSTGHHGEDRLSSLTEHKPIYSASHDAAGVALVKLMDYKDCASFNIQDLLQWLHRVHLCIDEKVGNYGFYKVDFTSGEFLIAANVSGPETFQVADKLLQFSIDVMKALKKVKSPITNKPVRIQVALTTGSVQSAILGKTALKFSIHGKPEIDSRILIQQLTSDQEIIASKDFFNALSESLQNWTKTSIRASSLIKEAYLYIPFENVEVSRKSLQSKGKLSMCFSDQTKEREFCLFQAQWLQGADVLYLGLSIARLMHNHNGLDPLLALALTILPLSYLIKNKLYTSYRQRVLSIVYVLTTVLWPSTSCSILTKMDSVESTSDMMQIIGALILFPFHVLLMVVSFILWLLNQWTACGNTLKQINEGDAIISWNMISQFILLFVIPFWISYNIEKHQRQIFNVWKKKDERIKN